MGTFFFSPAGALRQKQHYLSVELKFSTRSGLGSPLFALIKKKEEKKEQARKVGRTNMKRSDESMVPQLVFEECRKVTFEEFVEFLRKSGQPKTGGRLRRRNSWKRDTAGMACMAGSGRTTPKAGALNDEHPLLQADGDGKISYVVLSHYTHPTTARQCGLPADSRCPPLAPVAATTASKNTGLTTRPTSSSMITMTPSLLQSADARRQASKRIFWTLSSSPL